MKLMRSSPHPLYILPVSISSVRAPVRACLNARATNPKKSGSGRVIAMAAPRTIPEGTGLAAEGPFLKELTVGLEAVQMASRLCLVVQRQLANSEKQSKDDASPVTVADYGAQAVVAYMLQKGLPGRKISLVAEEDSEDLRKPEGAVMLKRIVTLVNDVLSSNGVIEHPLTPEAVTYLIDVGTSPGGCEGLHFVLDPIDGTRGFVGMRQYSVCLALLDQGQPVMGILGCPNLPATPLSDDDGRAGAAAKGGNAGVGVLFAAVKGRGAYSAALFDRGPPTTKISIGDFSAAAGKPVRFMESYESRHSSHTLAAAVAQKLGIKEPSLRADSQVKYGALARGDAAAFMRFPPPTYREKIWDHAPGVLIVQEAGGVVTDAEGAPLDFGRGRYLSMNTGIVAAGPEMHAKIVEAVKQLKAEGVQ